MIVETTDRTQALHGMRVFLDDGQRTRCEVMISYAEEVDVIPLACVAKQPPVWRPLPCHGNRALIVDLERLVAFMKEREQKRDGEEESDAGK